ncbi:MAG: endonuclease MutS2 [Desulfomonilaceae bacterium]
MSDVINECATALELPVVLQEVAGHARSVPGKLAILKTHPEADPSIVTRNLNLAMEFKEVLKLHGEFNLGGVAPLGGIFDRLAGSSYVLGPEEVLGIRDLLDVVSSVKRKLEDLDDRFVILKQYIGSLNSLGQLRAILRGALDENGIVRPNASPELIRIGNETVTLRGKIHKKLEKLIKDRDLARVVQEDYVTVRNDRYVILLRPEFKGVLDGIVHDHSRSGASVYVEPFDVVEQNNRMASLADEEREAILQVYRRLTDEVRLSLENLVHDYNTLVELDGFQARGEYAISNDCHAPELAEQGFSILGARHPLLLAADEVNVVPMDVIQDSETLVTIISGPNMGGKTVALKIAGLFPLMTRCGILPPVREGSKIKLFSRIMVDIGDEQDIRGRVSSFSGHLLRIKAILEVVREGDLVLLDELGGFTDPDEGAALAMAIIDEMKSKRAHVVVTTHLTQLKAYALSKPDTKNVSAEFHPVTLKPTFHLLYDLPGESHAITTAETLGLPASVINGARRYADAAAGGSVALIANLKEKIESLNKAREEVDLLKGALNRELAETVRERADLAETFRKEAAELIKHAEKELSSLRQSLKSGQIRSGKQVHEKIGEIKQEFVKKLEVPLTKPKSILSQGTHVKIKSLDKQGTVLTSPERGKIDVRVGNVTVRVAPEDLTPIKISDSKKNSSKKSFLGVNIPLATPGWEVNVIGMRVDEALPIVEKAIDNAILGGLTSLRIVHGKGTGRLKKAITEYLSNHALVLGSREGLPQEGGAGATIVDLRPE